MLPQVGNFDPCFAETGTQNADNASRVNSIWRSFSGKPATAYLNLNTHADKIFHKAKQSAKNWSIYLHTDYGNFFLDDNPTKKFQHSKSKLPSVFKTSGEKITRNHDY